MFNRKIVKNVLNNILKMDVAKGRRAIKPSGDQDSLISMLIHDVFGGDILKTHKSNGWYFYNRINGERIDFCKAESGRTGCKIKFEDIPATPDETFGYFDKTDYSAFFMRFVKVFEETVGLDHFRHDPLPGN
jgi:hypothetical protein